MLTCHIQPQHEEQAAVAAAASPTWSLLQGLLVCLRLYESSLTLLCMLFSCGCMLLTTASTTLVLACRDGGSVTWSAVEPTIRR
jgi:hypothetical protein